jgi:hypothetical protein
VTPNAKRLDSEGQQDRGGQRVAECCERDRLQLEVVEADLDQDPGGRPQEGDQQRLGDRQQVGAAGAQSERSIGP